jgi:hypothetical protein
MPAELPIAGAVDDTHAATPDLVFDRIPGIEGSNGAGAESISHGWMR